MDYISAIVFILILLMLVNFVMYFWIRFISRQCDVLMRLHWSNRKLIDLLRLERITYYGNIGSGPYTFSNIHDWRKYPDDLPEYNRKYWKRMYEEIANLPTQGSDKIN